jgi:hypothetical protein
MLEQPDITNLLSARLIPRLVGEQFSSGSPTEQLCRRGQLLASYNQGMFKLLREDMDVGMSMDPVRRQHLNIMLNITRCYKEMDLLEQPDIMNLLSARLIPGSVGHIFQPPTLTPTALGMSLALSRFMMSGCSTKSISNQSPIDIADTRQ